MLSEMSAFRYEWEPELEGVGNLCTAKLPHAHLERALLCHAILREADMHGAYLQEADLREAKLQKAYLCGA